MTTGRGTEDIPTDVIDDTNRDGIQHDDDDDEIDRIDDVPKPSLSTFLVIAVIFIGAFSALLLVYYNFPTLDASEKAFIKLPRNLDDAKHLGRVLDRYKNRYYVEVLSGVIVTYVFLQTFAIPGSLFLSILSGFLFPFYTALILVCMCSATGASMCYLLSQQIGRRVVAYFLAERVRKWSRVVREHNDNMLFYVVFLRVTPVVPNWFINLVAPVLNVPLMPFALGTFLGVAPPSFIAIQAGRTLNEMTSTNAFSWYSVGWLSFFAIVSLLPVWFKSRFKSKVD